MGKKENNKYEYTAVYIGRRLRVDGKVLFQHFTRTDNGEEMCFSGVKKVWIGHTYRCGAKHISSRPERVSEIDRIDNEEWESQDALVDAYRSKKRAESKIFGKTSPAIKAAILSLEPLFKNLAHYERVALIEYLASRGKKK